MIDLHIHSHYSDGTDTIEQIIAKAKALKLTQIAITDHNTIEGALYAQSLKKDNDIDIIKGIEISCDHEDQELHVLGYFPASQKDFQPLYDLIQYNENSKFHSQNAMIKRLNERGILFSYEDLKKAYPNVILNRVHIAKMIVSIGAAKDVDEAFDSYIGKEMPCYVKSNRCDAYSAIKAIHACNGLVYLAHPFEYKKTFEVLDHLLPYLDGIEVKHSSFNEEQTQALLQYAHKHQLKTSGGSDYHGENKKDAKMGEPHVENTHSIVFL